jgi:integrase
MSSRPYLRGELPAELPAKSVVVGPAHWRVSSSGRTGRRCIPSTSAATSSGSRSAGLPPDRLHDLRHRAATLALAGGADLKTASEMLGHSTITITADTYASVLLEVARSAAEAAARLVPRGGQLAEPQLSGPI